MNAAHEALDEIERHREALRSRAMVGDLWRVCFVEMATLLSEAEVRNVLERCEKTFRGQSLLYSTKFTDAARPFVEEALNDFVVSANEALAAMYPKK